MLKPTLFLQWEQCSCVILNQATPPQATCSEVFNVTDHHGVVTLPLKDIFTSAQWWKSIFNIAYSLELNHVIFHILIRLPLYLFQDPQLYQLKIHSLLKCNISL